MKPLTIILPLALLSLPASAAITAYSNDADTAALYHLDEATGTYSANTGDYVIADSSSNSQDLRTNAVAAGTPFLGVTGPAGLGTAMTQTSSRRAYRVDNVNGSLFNTQTFTIEAWIRNPTLGGYPTIFRVDDVGQGEAVNFSLDNNATTPTLRIGFFNSAGTWTAYTSTATVSLDTDTWYHVAVTYSGDGTGNDSSLEFFFDSENDLGASTRGGTKLGTTVVADDITALTSTGSDIWLGESAANAHLGGNIDEVRWSNTVRTEFNLAAVPEPSSAALIGLGGLALILRRRK